MRAFRLDQKKYQRLALICVALLIPFTSLSNLGHADDGKSKAVDIGGKTVNLALPENMCEMDPNNPADKRLIDGSKASIKGVNELLMQFADCQELKDWRVGKQLFLDNFGSYQASNKFIKLDFTGKESQSIGQICDVFKKQGAEVLNTVKPEVNERIKSGFGDIKLNELKMLGVVHDLEDICAVATFQRLKTEKNTTKNQLNVYSITVVNGRLLFTYLFSPEGTDNLKQKSIEIKALNQINQNNNKQQ